MAPKKSSTKVTGIDDAKDIKSLIPLGSKYLEHGFNVLLIGLHGTGKTISVMDLAAEHDMNFKYFSCSTLDPYTDLVGVPVPMNYCSKCSIHYHITDKLCEKCNGVMSETLKSIRPREIDEAELIFFDEFNRADSKTTNAVFEIIQFHSINGEKLPNLRACWAAINPPDNDYQVEELDPALLDRFDLYIEIKPDPSVKYMVGKGIDLPVAQVLKQWWNDQDHTRRTKGNNNMAAYISPRRLEKIGRIYTLTDNFQSVIDALPKGVAFEVSKLKLMLEKATGKISENEVSALGKEAADFVYSPGEIIKKQKEIIDYVQNNPNELETQKKIIEVFVNQQLSEETLVRMYGSLLNSLQPAVVESLFDGFSSTKKTKMRQVFEEYKQNNPDIASKLTNLEGIISSG